MTTTSSWTKPQPGQIIRYVYLWRWEHKTGREDGRKIRPCLVVATYEHRGFLRVITAPLTTRDYTPENSIVIPQPVIDKLRLDPRARIIWNDLNEFTWVGPDVRAGTDGSPLIGHLPEKLWRQVINKIVEHRVPPTRRSE